MGVDIVCFIEVSASTAENTATFESYAELSLPRQRDLFEAMGYDNNGLYPPRGLPSNCGSGVTCSYGIQVCDPEDEEKWRGSQYASRSDAEAWVNSGKASYIGNGPWLRGTVSNPDAYRPSWLTSAEYANAVACTESEMHPINPEYYALLAVLNALEQHYSQVRIVFWFDV